MVRLNEVKPHLSKNHAVFNLTEFYHKETHCIFAYIFIPRSFVKSMLTFRHFAQMLM